MRGESIRILLVEDNPGDVDLTLAALKRSKLAIQGGIDVLTDGEKVMPFLTAPGRQRPDLILLDLNLPGKDGREVLDELKQHPELRMIPVVILTSSEAEADVVKSYKLHANAYVTKPLDLVRFDTIVHAIDAFWFTVVKLPPRE